MIAADRDGRRELAARHEVVERDAERRALPLPQPADARGQPLEVDALLREGDPPAQVLVVREQLEHEGVRARDVLRIAGERDPPERTFPLAEQRADVLGDEAGNLERVLDAGVERDGAEVVAVVEGDGAPPLEREHGAHVTHRGRRAARHVLIGIALAQRRGIGHRQPIGDVAAQHVVRARLVGERVHLHAAREQCLECGRGVHHHGDGPRHPRPACCLDECQPFIERSGLHVAVAGLDPLVDPRFVHVEGEHDGALHRGGQRLRAAHPTQPGGDDELAREGPAELSPRHGPKGLVGALHDPLRADIDPGARGHLPVHHQALPLQLAEVLPRGPSAYEVGVRDEDAGRPCMRPEDGDRLPTLHEQRLVMLEGAQRRDDRVEGRPATRRLPRPAVHHQLVRTLGHIRVEVVHQHAERRFLLPALARDRAAARRAHLARARHDGGGRHGSRIPKVKCPRSIASARTPMSVERTRSWPSGCTSSRTSWCPRAAPRPARNGRR